MMNKAIIQGRLVADPEMRITPSGVAVTSFRIAVERNFKGQSGERSADFLPCIAWRGTASLIDKYFRKGMMILVDGHLQVRSYDDKDGVRRIATEIIVDSAYFCDSKRQEVPQSDCCNSDNIPEPPQVEFTEFSDDGELPF